MTPHRLATIGLIDAVDKGDVDKVVFFLRKKKNLRLNVNVKDPHNNDSPILHVVIYNATKHVNRKLYFMSVLGRVKGAKEKAVTAARARRDDIKIIRLLIHHGADVNIHSSDQNDDMLPHTDALHIAAKYDPLLIQYLIKSPSASINSRDENGYTPLHYAVVGLRPRQGGDEGTQQTKLRQRISMIKLLLKHPKIRINCRDKQGKTPLLIAVNSDKADVVKIFLKDGANPNIKDNNGKSPLDYNYENIVEQSRGFLADVPGGLDDVKRIRAMLLEYGATKNPHRERARKKRARKAAAEAKLKKRKK